MTNKEIRVDLKEFIELFASKNIQYKTWFLRDLSTREDPGEFYSMLFDDFGVEDFVYAQDNYLTEKENDELKIFIDMLNVYGDLHKNWQGYFDFDSKEVYYDPQWNKIREQAKKLYELLDKNEGLEPLKIIENWSY